MNAGDSYNDLLKSELHFKHYTSDAPGNFLNAMKEHGMDTRTHVSAPPGRKHFVVAFQGKQKVGHGYYHEDKTQIRPGSIHANHSALAQHMGDHASKMAKKPLTASQPPKATPTDYGLPTKEHFLKSGQSYNDLRKTEQEELKKTPVQAFSGFANVDDWHAQNMPRSIYSSEDHDVKTTKVGTLHGKSLYHHVISDRGIKSKKQDATYQHLLSQHKDPSKNGVVHLSGETYKGALQIYASAAHPHYQGMGLGTKLYELAAKHHGALSSDYALSDASDAIYRKLAQKKDFKAKLQPWGKEQGHYLQYKKPKKK